MEITNKQISSWIDLKKSSDNSVLWLQQDWKTYAIPILLFSLSSCCLLWAGSIYILLHLFSIEFTLVTLVISWRVNSYYTSFSVVMLPMSITSQICLECPLDALCRLPPAIWLGEWSLYVIVVIYSQELALLPLYTNYIFLFTIHHIMCSFCLAAWNPLLREKDNKWKHTTIKITILQLVPT